LSTAKDLAGLLTLSFLVFTPWSSSSSDFRPGMDKEGEEESVRWEPGRIWDGWAVFLGFFLEEKPGAGEPLDAFRMWRRTDRRRTRAQASLVRVKEHVPPCVVLVINDNSYGLMFALSYIFRTCP
jgi:hypothetical protein